MKAYPEAIGIFKQRGNPMTKSLTGKVALVTGGSRGIGAASARALADQGAEVAISYGASADKAEAVVRDLKAKGVRAKAFKADQADSAQVERLVQDVAKEFGHLDILINNAGVGATGHFADAAPERLRTIMEVNFFGLTETTRLFLPLLKLGNLPAIVNVSSVIGKRALPGSSEYCASKFAVQGFSEALRAELDKDGVDVLVVCPGRTRTNFMRNLLEKKTGRIADQSQGQSSEHVAEATLRALERGKNEICLTLSGWLMVTVNRFWPGLVNWIAARRARRQIV